MVGISIKSITESARCMAESLSLMLMLVLTYSLWAQ